MSQQEPGIYRAMLEANGMPKRQTEFQTECKAALSRGASHDELLHIVRRFKADGVTQREAYDALHEIWLEQGYDEDDGEGEDQLRDNLEYAMEVVWYGQRGIWESGLSNTVK